MTINAISFVYTLTTDIKDAFTDVERMKVGTCTTKDCNELKKRVNGISNHLAGVRYVIEQANECDETQRLLEVVDNLRAELETIAKDCKNLIALIEPAA